MSNKKRNVAFIKPEEPAFLIRLKREAGFKEGPTLDTKREKLPELSDDDEHEENIDDSPVVVVLKQGDLSKGEADELKKKQDLEEASRPANLDDRIVFQPPKKREAVSAPDDKTTSKKKKSTAHKKSKLLSFDEDELDD